MTEKLLNTREVAQYLGLSYATLRDWVSARRLPYYKIGRAVRFRQSEIEQWLDRQAVEQRNLEKW